MQMNSAFVWLVVAVACANLSVCVAWLYLCYVVVVMWLSVGCVFCSLLVVAAVL